MLIKNLKTKEKLDNVLLKELSLLKKLYNNNRIIVEAGGGGVEVEAFEQSNFIVLKTAYLYYIEEQPQEKIAKRLHISAPTVSRLLKKAKKDKIVEFVIRDPYLECIEIEKKLKKRFNLKEVIVAPNPTINTADNIKKQVALEGARYIQRVITENDTLGVTWGNTIYYLIHYLNPCRKVDAKFVTLHGSISICDNELDVRNLVSRMAMAFGGKRYYLLTEGLMSSSRIVDEIKKEKYINQVFKMFKEVTMAVNGLGSFFPHPASMLAQSNYLSNDELTSLQKENVAGDIALRFFDVNGKECDTDLKQRTIAIELSDFKKIKNKITVAGGEYKTYTVFAALKGGLIDVLITDYSLGSSLLKLI